MICIFFSLIFQELRSFLEVRLQLMPTLFNHIHIQVGLVLKKNVIFSSWKRYFVSKFWIKNFSLRFLEEIDKIFLLDAEMHTIWSKDPISYYSVANIWFWKFLLGLVFSVKLPHFYSIFEKKFIPLATTGRPEFDSRNSISPVITSWSYGVKFGGLRFGVG